MKKIKKYLVPSSPLTTRERREQGGKMNIIEKFKKGSGIHIKKENKGKFTDYCGGKVTSECIAKGKNSPNAAIRKRATFADNARKWKRKAQMGMLIEFALNLKNLPTDLTNSALNFYSDYKKSDSNRDKELALVGLEKAIALEEELKKIKALTLNYLLLLNASSPLGINYSPIDARTKSYSENTGIEKANNIYNTKVLNINNKYKLELIDSLNKFASSILSILSKVLNPSKGSSENLDASSIFGNLDTSSIFGNLTSILPV